jgi:predicted transcriptional regulator
MDVLTPPKGCDPWATYTATRLKDQALSPAGEKIMAVVRDRHPVRLGELMEATGLERAALEREMATLRHMELLTAVQLPDGDKGFGPFGVPGRASD